VKKIVAIIQARMSSERLPGKVLLSLAGHSTLWWMCARLSYTSVNNIAVATTDDVVNDPIANKSNYPYGCEIFRYVGHEDDVIGRILAAAKKYEADIIVDITGDCPLIDPIHVNYLIQKLRNDPVLDYASNCVTRTWPDGLDIQVYRTHVLQRTIALYHPLMHGGWNIAQHPEKFNIENWEASSDMYWPELGLTLDTLEDYDLLSIIFNIFGHNPDFPVTQVVQYLREHPELLEINKNVRRKTPEEG